MSFFKKRKKKKAGPNLFGNFMIMLPQPGSLELDSGFGQVPKYKFILIPASITIKKVWNIFGHISREGQKHNCRQVTSLI